LSADRRALRRRDRWRREGGGRDRGNNGTCRGCVCLGRDFDEIAPQS